MDPSLAAAARDVVAVVGIDDLLAPGQPPSAGSPLSDLAARFVGSRFTLCTDTPQLRFDPALSVVDTRLGLVQALPVLVAAGRASQFAPDRQSACRVEGQNIWLKSPRSSR